jgi:hypothetical protein
VKHVPPTRALLRAALVLLACGAAPPAAANGVRIAGRAAAFADLQSAVDAAVDGERLPVGAGTYAGFVVDDKALAIFALPGASVHVDGAIEVQDLAAGKTFVLAGFDVTGAPGVDQDPSIPQAGGALVLEDDAGLVWVQGCTLTGGRGGADIVCGQDCTALHGDGGDALSARSSPQVALTGCTLHGGEGGEIPPLMPGEEPPGFDYGGRGGTGIALDQAALAIYGCTVLGGEGGDSTPWDIGAGGAGGDAVGGPGGAVFAAGSSLAGGAGGYFHCWDTLALGASGNGGDGIATGVGADVRATARAGGSAGGDDFGCVAISGTHGVADHGVTDHAGAFRSIAADAVRPDGGTLVLDLVGLPGDEVHVAQTTSAAWTPLPAFSDVWLLFLPQVPPAPQGVVGAGGTGTASLAGFDVAPCAFADVVFYQAEVVESGSGATTLTNPLAVLTLDGFGIDCDGNGVHDLVDVLLGTVPDADGDLVPDGCAPPPATFCDAGDGALASCPCANPGYAHTGCDLPPATGGVGFVLLAQRSSPANRATLCGTGYPPMGTPTTLVIRAAGLDAASPVVFGDGLRCISVPLVRLTATTAAAGSALHTFGHGAMAGAGTFFYQTWFRSTPIMYCDPLAAFSLSSGVELGW